MKFLSKCYIGLIFFLLYIPIVVLIVFSFNESYQNDEKGAYDACRLFQEPLFRQR